MGYRTFEDRQGRVWEIRPRSKTEWEFHPGGGATGLPRSATAPGYETDPYELSVEELQRLLDASQPPPSRSRPSPFTD